MTDSRCLPRPDHAPSRRRGGGNYRRGAGNAARTMILPCRLQSGCNSYFVAIGAGANYLKYLSGDVAERLKAAVC